MQLKANRKWLQLQMLTSENVYKGVITVPHLTFLFCSVEIEKKIPKLLLSNKKTEIKCYLRKDSKSF